MKKEPLQWPDDMGESLPDIWVDDLLEAALTFPNETGLGWDRLHPKVVCRLSRALVLDLVRIMIICEQVGEWPDNVALVLIALLAKTDGGYRPSGLVPFLPRLWMRCRKGVAARWEGANSRPYPYAGKGMGADVAAWRQAAIAELAATMGIEVEYAQVLLDLVKAFDHATH